MQMLSHDNYLINMLFKALYGILNDNYFTIGTINGYFISNRYPCLGAFSKAFSKSIQGNQSIQ